MQSLRWILITLSLLSSACSAWPNPAAKDGTDELEIGDGASRGEEVSRKVTGKAAVVLELKTGAQVKIPKGAVDKEVTVTLKRPKDSEAVKLVENVGSKYGLASAPYVITPHGTKFKTEVEVTLPIARGRDPNNVKVLWRKDEEDLEWKELPTPKVSKQKAIIKVDHFSLFLLVEERSDDDVDYGDGDDDDYGSDNGDGDSPGGGTTNGDGDSNGSVGTPGLGSFVEQLIGPQGGRLELQTPQGVATLEVPAGALQQPVTLRLERVSSDVHLSTLDVTGLTDIVPGLTEHELVALINGDDGTLLTGLPGLVGFTTTEPVLRVQPEMVFALPVTLQIPLAVGDDVLVRDMPNRMGAYLATNAVIVNGRGVVTTRKSGSFAALSGSNRAAAVTRAKRPYASCLLERSASSEPATAGCLFQSSCNARVGCTATGSCTCYGGALGQATFQGSCESGVTALATQAAELCEWSGVVPYLPENAWWEIQSAADTSSCDPGYDFNVGSYAWTGSNGYRFSPNWESSWPTVELIDIVAGTGARVEAFEDACLRYQRTNAAPCPEPAGLVSGGTTTRITLRSESHSESGVSLEFQTNQPRGLPPDSFLEYWGVSCWNATGAPVDWTCSCARYHLEGGPNSLSYTHYYAALTVEAALRIALSSETESDVAQLIADCGWPEVELLPSRQYTQPESGPSMPSVAPVCFAP